MATSDVSDSTASMAGTGATTGSVVPGVGTAIGAAVGGALGLVGGILGSKSAKKQQAAADAKINQALAKLQEREAAISKLIEGVDEADRANIEKSIKAYAEIDQIQAQALADGKRDLAAQYQAMKDLLDTNLNVELTAIGKNYAELKQNLDDFSKTARSYVESDIASQKALREQFDTDTSKVIPAIKKAMDRTEQRIGEIQSRGGLPPEADAVLSKTSEGLKNAKVKFEQSEALNRGMAGGASRKAGFDIAAVKALAEVNASLRTQGTAELQNLGAQQMQTAAQLQAVSANRQAALQDTSGAQRLAAEQGLFSSQQQLTAARQAQELGATTQAGQSQAELLSRRGAAELGMEQAYAKDRAAILESGMKSETALAQQRSMNRAALEGSKTQVATSFADVLRGAAGNLSTQAAASMQNAAAGFQTAGLMAVRGIDAYRLQLEKKKTDPTQQQNANLGAQVAQTRVGNPIAAGIPDANGAGWKAEDQQSPSPFYPQE